MPAFEKKKGKMYKKYIAYFPAELLSTPPTDIHSSAEAKAKAEQSVLFFFVFCSGIRILSLLFGD